MCHMYSFNYNYCVLDWLVVVREVEYVQLWCYHGDCCIVRTLVVEQPLPVQCVVIGLQSTGEARTLEALEEGGGELNDFVSTAKYEST